VGGREKERNDVKSQRKNVIQFKRNRVNRSNGKKPAAMDHGTRSERNGRGGRIAEKSRLGLHGGGSRGEEGFFLDVDWTIKRIAASPKSRKIRKHKKT